MKKTVSQEAPAIDIRIYLDEIRASRRYKSLDLPESTLRDLVEQESLPGRTPKQIDKSVREKLHNIVAPYLGDPDYDLAEDEMQTAFASGQDSDLRKFCLEMLLSHASTHERCAAYPDLGDFYRQIWAVTGLPGSILDLACGLHPFGLPWMGLPRSARYVAYDLHAPRVELIGHFLHGYQQAGGAYHRDILVEPPQEQAEVAFFFKEAHRFEQRQKGCNRAFWEALKVRWLLVSLPAASLTGRHDLAEKQRKLVHSTLAGLDWPVQELLLGNELVFCIRKS
jgi:16S rRNA (guanine(1405)-N(7))-methyltransferase